MLKKNPRATKSVGIHIIIYRLMVLNTSLQIHEKSTNALKEAVLTFPSVVPLLADKADISLSGAVRGHKAFRIHTDARCVSCPYQTLV